MADINRTIGEILKEGREKKGLSLEEVSLLTKIKPRYLAAIEADNWEVLPSAVQQKGFVRSYARAMEIDPAPLLARLRSLIHPEDLEPEIDQPEVEEDQPGQTQEPLEEIGDVLKAQREKLGFTIQNVADQIFIPVRYLDAIEAGDLEELPSSVQGKGMVKNYAQFLGLDPDPLLLGFASALQNRLAKSREDIPAARSPSSLTVSIRRFLASPTIIWAGLAILIGALLFWTGSLLFGTGGGTSDTTATIPGVSDILLPTATFTATSEAPPPTQSEIEVDVPDADGNEITIEGEEFTPTPGITGNEKVQVQLVIQQRTWVRVIVDNILVFEGRLQAGSVKLFGGELFVEVLTGNAAGVDVIYNQRDLGTMGLYGEVVDRVFTADGVATPTPTITLTPIPTDTPEATSTPAPTIES
jgi:cytoskeletal protein RodZ